MALVNVNKKSTQSNQEPSTSKPQDLQNSVEVSSLGKNMALKSNVQVKTNRQGIKEYDQIKKDEAISEPIDPSVNLDQKIADIRIANRSETTGNEKKSSPPTYENLSKVSSKKIELIEIIKTAIFNEASDIHLTVGYRPMIRVDGSLKTLNAKEITQDEMFEYCSQMTQDRDIDLNKIKHIDLSYTHENRRFRVNIFRMMGNLSLVARLIPKKIKTIDELELPQITKELAKIPSGLILLTGPTGSGKSTTLAAMLNHINNSRSEHIVTLEDPIEFVFPKGRSLIDQREKGQDFDSWEQALRAILRQDPNVVLVGEMRDFETIASTITVSETGHLVFATLHTNSASQTIDRIVDVFPEKQQAQIRTQLAQVIVAIISQRLVPLPNGGRKAVHEVLIATPAVKNVIREGLTHQIDNMIQTGQDYGMITMEKSLVALIRKGLISVETAKETSIRPGELDILLGQG